MSVPGALVTVNAEFPVLLASLEKRDAGAVLAEWRESSLMLRVVRGRKMRTVDALFDEVAAALQFPSYFGENWPAFDECLADMDWLTRESGIVIVVPEPAQVLSDSSTADLAVLARIVKHAAETYAEAIALGEWWDRPALPFHVVLLAGPSEFEAARSRWMSADAAIAGLDL